ncbi:bifunctional lysylphosphatidylglycerol flippase/synthetase MprF [Oryzibacter oryziterrae]|uniref:bifunctional lysylphosphatidylglycerol flippase/synthetase MprF n=1 Tax=Oryzibacter oryziterrae TaxID=2766474 RepID=UPI001F393D80|nr:bifunctional lysylphosphatidylglycerol flippase/synthetase MprF [Oryzibacter oryziterrae]
MSKVGENSIGHATDVGSSELDAVRVSVLGRFKPAIIGLIAFAVVGLSAVALTHLLSDFAFDDFIAAVEDTTWTNILLAIAFTAVSFLALSVYDLQALRFAGAKMPYRVVSLASFCAYSVGNIAGFGPLTGGSIRYRFYSPLGLAPETIAKIVAYVAGAFGLGLTFVTGIGLTLSGGALATSAGLSTGFVHVAGWVALGIVVAVLIVSAVMKDGITIKGWSLSLPSTGDLLVQIVATSVDVIAAAAVLYVLLPPGDVSFLLVLSVFSVAIGAGVLSHLPGGVGVFETIIVGGLGSHLPLDGIVSAVFLYRVIYFVLPLAVAVLVLIGAEAQRATKANPALANALSGITPTLIGTLTVVLGAMLVFSAVTPKDDDNIDLISSLFPLPLVESAHFTGSIIGVFLMVAGRGLVHRLDGAWWLAMLLTALSIPLALVKAMAVGEAVMLGILILSLLASRPIFRRRASLLHDRLTASWWTCIGIVLALAFGILLFDYKEVPYSHGLWWQFEFDAEAPRSLRAAFGIGLATAAIAATILTRPPRGRITPPTREELDLATAIVATSDRADANLVQMGDKSLMFSDDGKAFLMFSKRGRSWVALGDPVGAEEGQQELIWRFVELAREHGGRAAFYQASAEMLSFYADAGLSAFKLGEEAVVDLARFDLKGSKKGNLRNAMNKAEREGILFEVLPPEAVPAILDELQAVSVAWLGDRKEKTFSLGAFDRDYMLRQPVAVLKRDGKIYAFANIMLAGDKTEAGIDLMRFVPSAPNGTMELLFTRLLLHYKQEGYAHFTLGMAPLSGLSESPIAPLWHKLGRAAFEHGSAFYNFHGLKAFKAKYDPDWQHRYMAVAGGLNPVLALADVTFIIGGGLKGVISK